LVANTAANGATGGIEQFAGGVITVTNSIVAQNSVSNIVGAFTNTNNLIDGDPLLGPLGNNGGRTQTMPPLPGSPAIDRCTNGTPFITDQRGLPRVVGEFADIGAVEFYPYHPLASGSFTQNWSNTGLITTNATGNDEWVGIDDISISGTLPTPIHEIQGSGDTSPLSGQKVTIQGIVTSGGTLPLSTDQRKFLRLGFLTP
jgi:hypothetical protein